MDYIVKNLESLDDIYAYALASYALELAEHTAKDFVFRTFDSKAKIEGTYLCHFNSKNLKTNFRLNLKAIESGGISPFLHQKPKAFGIRNLIPLILRWQHMAC